MKHFDTHVHLNLGYTATVELSGGDIFTAYYMQSDLKTIKWTLN
jgi:hypothetical protein